VVLGSKDKEGKKSKKRDTKEAADDSVSRKKKKKSLLYVLILYFVCTLATGRQQRAFSTLLRQSGLRASTCGILAAKSECKMLASTCFYSLYAWLN